MKLSLGFSPCPNDTFIFDALVNNKIDTGSLAFDVVLEDVETLNNLAKTGTLSITKLSYGVLPLVLDTYRVLNSGSALGSGAGPLLISKNNTTSLVEQQELVNKSTIAIPGEHTTAHLLFSLAYPQARKKIFMRYDEIESFVLDDKGLGVIIHENRFTYAAKGLHKITDLGDYWETKTGNPIPLGGIAVKRSIDDDLCQTINRLIGESIACAYRHHYEDLATYVKQYAQEMSEPVMRQHINLYVNKFSVNLGKPGQDAVMKMLEVYSELHDSPVFTKEHVFTEPHD